MYAPRGPKSARRWGSEPTLRPRPSHQAGCLARLDRGEGAQRERTRGPASKQQAAKGPRSPLLQDPEQLQLRLCPRGPPIKTIADKSVWGEGAASAKYRSARSYQPGTQTRTAARKFGHARAGRGQREKPPAGRALGGWAGGAP